MERNPMRVVAVAGGFDPVHIGHVEHIKAANLLGGKLIVMLNSDDCMVKKKGRPFMPFEERKAILESLKWVDEVVPVIDKDRTVTESLRYYRPDIFAKGGDRTPDNMPQSELDVCKELGIEIIYDIGGEKVQSSSKLTGLNAII